MKRLLILLALFAAVSAEAANWFVNQAVGSSGNGQSWSTAWKQPNNVVWSSVSAGDTIWVAGGTYTAGFRTLKNATAWTATNLFGPK